MMRKKPYRKISVIILCFLVLGLSIGFAAYSQNLIINSTGKIKAEESPWLISFAPMPKNIISTSEGDAYVIKSSFETYASLTNTFLDTSVKAAATGNENGIPDSTEFLSYEDLEKEAHTVPGYMYYSDGINIIDGVHSKDDYGEDTVTSYYKKFTVTPGTVNHTTISGITANFSSAGQYAVFPFIIENYGLREGFLNSVSFTGDKTCTDTENTLSDEQLNAICADTHYDIKVGRTVTGTSVDEISETQLPRGSFMVAYVVIGVDDPSGEDWTGLTTDNEVTVTFPSIVLGFDSVD